MNLYGAHIPFVAGVLVFALMLVVFNWKSGKRAG